jgi:hypothetical protein
MEIQYGDQEEGCEEEGDEEEGSEEEVEPSSSRNGGCDRKTPAARSESFDTVPAKAGTVVFAIRERRLQGGLRGNMR